jgi:ABC-type Zn uptake system ZnuABC Zn-binding protein ZnuA
MVGIRPRSWKPLTLLALAMQLAIPLLAPQGASGGVPPLPVVTSNTVLADFVRNIGGDAVQIRALAPAGSDPHTFQPTPDTMKILSQARVAFFNGSGLEEWWGKTVTSVGRKDLPVVELSRGLATIQTSGHEHGGHSHAEGVDPHVWLDPILVKQYVNKIREALAREDQANAARYAERTAAYQVMLEELDAWIRAEIGTIPEGRRKIVTFHNAFQYFANRYGLAVKGYIVVSPGKEPSAKGLAELVRRIRQDQVPAVFAEADFNPKILESLGRDAGVKVVTNLYDGSLSAGPPADTYLNLMRHNTTQMVSALR